MLINDESASVALTGRFVFQPKARYNDGNPMPFGDLDPLLRL
jgi:hypothetical protein